MEEQEVYLAFRRAGFYRNISQVCLVVGAILVLLRLMTYIGLIVGVVGIALNLIFWKCPICSKFLPMRSSVSGVKHCPKCGIRLQL